jgi:hypothetical protein
MVYLLKTDFNIVRNVSLELINYWNLSREGGVRQRAAEVCAA